MLPLRHAPGALHSCGPRTPGWVGLSLAVEMGHIPALECGACLEVSAPLRSLAHPLCARDAQVGKPLDEIGDELEAKLTEIHKRFEKPIVISECGADTLPGCHMMAPGLWSEEFQACRETCHDMILRDRSVGDAPSRAVARGCRRCEGRGVY